MRLVSTAVRANFTYVFINSSDARRRCATVRWQQETVLGSKGVLRRSKSLRTMVAPVNSSVLLPHHLRSASSSALSRAVVLDP